PRATRRARHRSARALHPDPPRAARDPEAASHPSGLRLRPVGARGQLGAVAPNATPPAPAPVGVRWRWCSERASDSRVESGRTPSAQVVSHVARQVSQSASAATSSVLSPVMAVRWLALTFRSQALRLVGLAEKMTSQSALLNVAWVRAKDAWHEKARFE